MKMVKHISKNIKMIEKVIDKKRINLSNPTDNEVVIIATRQMAKKAGFGEVREFMIATAASELATNILRYAKKGKIIISLIQCSKNNGIEIIAVDDGPGIKDIEKAFEESFSTDTNSLGLGLSCVERIMDEVIVFTESGMGTKIVVRIWQV